VTVAATVRSIRSGGSIVPDKRLLIDTATCGVDTTSQQPEREGLTAALAVELAPVRVNVVSPGLARTRRWNVWTDTAPHDLYRREEQRLSVRHVGEAAEIATAYLYLMENSYATGTVVVADGGALV
jgi:hypothetical protein